MATHLTTGVFLL